MAPEVMEQADGYDYPADIWSLGITAIELSDGDAPYSDLPAMKVLMSVINSPSPTLKRDKQWSHEFKCFVDNCLFKTPELRPTTMDLLKDHKKFFDKGKNAKYLKDNLIKNLKPLTERFNAVLNI